MKGLFHFLLLASSVSLSSCSGYNEANQFQEYERRYLQAQNEYCSTNVLVAESGLLAFRQWISDRDRAGKPRFNYYLNLLQVDARLFSLYDFLGEHDKAEAAYQDGVRAYGEYLRDHHFPAHTISKAEMLEQMARQEKGLEVGWKKKYQGTPSGSQSERP